MDRFELVARSLRGGETECWHFGAVAVCEPGGKLAAAIGDPSTGVFLRSAAKPFQALAMMALGLDVESLRDDELALICASHGGFELHTRAVSELLARWDLEPAALLCGPHEPVDAGAARSLRESGAAPTSLHNNCSGKHAGMLGTCRAAGLSLGDYVSADHPLQREVARVIARSCRVEPETMGIGMDGCSVPSFQVPLAGVATAYADLAQPEGLDDPVDSARTARVYEAMTGSPEMVAGPGRFTTRLMEVGGGSILGKEGADGLYAVAVRAPRRLGIALKIADGTEVCRDGVVLEVLRQLGALDDEQIASLEDFRVPKRRNCRGRAVGEVVPEVSLPGLG